MTCKIEVQNSLIKAKIMKNKMKLQNLTKKVFRNELTNNELEIQKKIWNREVKRKIMERR